MLLQIRLILIMPMNLFCIFVIFIFTAISCAKSQRFMNEATETWTGRWFPSNPVTQRPVDLISPQKNVQMGVSRVDCDDAKTNLTLDWDGQKSDYQCMYPRTRIEPNHTIRPLVEFQNIPVAYHAPHYCMDQAIEYDSVIPTFGPHRPLWPKYGQYKYVPKQRWLHNVEHGGIVALYHPCADLEEIRQLKKAVIRCLRRHVITPYNGLSKERPLALVAWGVRMTMSAVDPYEVRQFVQDHALRGPEKVSQDGQFDDSLLVPAAVVSDFEDSQLCPHPFAHD